jgi:hypothetical protein
MLISSHPLSLKCHFFFTHVLLSLTLFHLSPEWQAGTSICRVIPALTRSGTKVTDVFEAVRPHMELTVNNILSHINTVFVLRTKAPQNTVLNPLESSSTSSPSTVSTVTPTASTEDHSTVKAASVSSFLTAASTVSSEQSKWVIISLLLHSIESFLLQVPLFVLRRLLTKG